MRAKLGMISAFRFALKLYFCSFQPSPLMVRLPDYFEMHAPEKLVALPGISLVQYAQTQTQNQNEVFLTRHLFVVVLEGEKVLHHAEGDTPVKAGQGIIIKAGCYAMSEIVPAGKTFRSVLFFISNELVQEFLQQSGFAQPSQVSAAGNFLFPFPVTPRLQNFLQGLTDNYLDTGLHHPQFDRLKSLELFYQLTFDNKGVDFRNFLFELSQTPNEGMLQVMEQYFDKHLQLEDYARLTNRSLAAFKRDFEKEFNTSPGAWVREKKLLKAYNLLTIGNKSVTEVCFECGFENLSHFVKAFKSKFQITPKQLQLERFVKPN